MHLYWVDGNHEDHARLDAIPLDPATGLRPISDHVVHLPRGYRWTWCDWAGQPHQWMALGGAVSVDRSYRTPLKTWWPQEGLSEDDIAKAIAPGDVDVMVSHDAPTQVSIPGIDGNPQGWPSDVLSDAERHQGLTREVMAAVHPRHLWHGHYHAHYDDRLFIGTSTERPNWDGVCDVHGLDKDESYWLANLALVDASGARLPWPETSPEDSA